MVSPLGVNQLLLKSVSMWTSFIRNCFPLMFRLKNKKKISTSPKIIFIITLPDCSLFHMILINLYKAANACLSALKVVSHWSVNQLFLTIKCNRANISHMKLSSYQVNHLAQENVNFINLFLTLNSVSITLPVTLNVYIKKESQYGPKSPVIFTPNCSQHSWWTLVSLSRSPEDTR